MKKNNIYPLLIFLSLTTFVSAQQPAHTTVSIDSRLYEVFEKGYLEIMITENPFLLQRWNFYLDNAWYVTELPAKKIVKEYPVISIDDLEDINIFDLEKRNGLKKDWNKQQVYLIDGTDKALVLISGKEFTKRLNEYLGKNPRD